MRCLILFALEAQSSLSFGLLTRAACSQKSGSLLITFCCTIFLKSDLKLPLSEYGNSREDRNVRLLLPLTFNLPLLNFNLNSRILLLGILASFEDSNRFILCLLRFFFCFLLPFFFCFLFRIFFSFLFFFRFRTFFGFLDIFGFVVVVPLFVRLSCRLADLRLTALFVVKVFVFLRNVLGFVRGLILTLCFFLGLWLWLLFFLVRY